MIQLPIPTMTTTAIPIPNPIIYMDCWEFEVLEYVLGVKKEALNINMEYICYVMAEISQ